MNTYLKDTPDLQCLKSKYATPSTLLIPASLLQYYKLRSKQFGTNGRKLYFHHLIQVYGIHLEHFGLSAHSSKWKKKYQAEGLDLHKLNFAPYPSDWEQMRHLGFAYGLAICKLFVVLLELEYNRYLDAGSPKEFMEVPPEINQKPNKNSGKPKNSYNSLDNFVQCLIATDFASPVGTLLIRDIDVSNHILYRTVWNRRI